MIKVIITLVVLCTLTACSKTQKGSQRTQPMDAIIDGTYATDAAMQEERVEQENYIGQQEQLYE
jgi:hypothetical protein|tara:strand:- start:64 stop:255 length:192 start_codon:yes stop_codon:yes gene_type:complete